MKRRTLASVTGGGFGVVVVFGGGFLSGRAWEVPGSTAFWAVAAQPTATVTAGVFAIAAAGVALYGVHLSNSQSRLRTDAEIEQREAAARAEIEQRETAARIRELWTRFEWVVDRMSSTSGAVIDEVQATDIVVAIRDAAEACGDTHLSGMLDVYMGDQVAALTDELGLEGAGGAAAGDNDGGGDVDVV